MSRARALQALVAASTPLPARASSWLCFGDDALDARLGGGLAEAALHEILAGHDGDSAAAAGFALLLALRSARPGPLLWLREDKARMNGRLYGLGLADLGFDPARLLLIEAPDTLAVLRAGAEAVACAAVGVVVIEPWGKAPAFDLTATRRLALAAARSGVTTLVLRNGEAGPSAATSRWSVAAAPSTDPGADVPGAPAFVINLLRHRGGIAGFETRLEWNRDRSTFVARPQTSLPRALPATAFLGTDHAAGRRAA